MLTIFLPYDQWSMGGPFHATKSYLVELSITKMINKLVLKLRVFKIQSPTKF